MPYTMDIYPDETEKYPVPKEGDLFVVVKIIPDVLDPHWGRCTGVELKPATPNPSTSPGAWPRCPLHGAPMILSGNGAWCAECHPEYIDESRKIEGEE